MPNINVATRCLLKAVRRGTASLPYLVNCLRPGLASCTSPAHSATSSWTFLGTLGLRVVEASVDAEAEAFDVSLAHDVCHTPDAVRVPSAAVLANLEQYSIDVPKVVQRYPPVASYGAERVERVTAYLAGLGLDVRRVVEGHPRVLAGQIEAYKAVVQLLAETGVEVTQTINRHPSVLTRRVVGLQHIIQVINSGGCRTADVVARCPSILRASAADLQSLMQLRELSNGAQQGRDHQRLAAEDPRAALLASLGLEADKLLRRAPHVLKCSLDKLRAVVAHLTELGVDVPKVLRRAPFVFGVRVEALKEREHFFAENGLDVVRHVNGYPMVLSFSVERKLRPILSFVVHELGRSPTDLDKAYSIWGCSLEGRLWPRFLYLQSVGKRLDNLNQFSCCSDKRFVAIFAGTDLQHYHAWMQLNGYSIHSD
eukprot:EG_transcript_12949